MLLFRQSRKDGKGNCLFTPNRPAGFVVTPEVAAVEPLRAELAEMQRFAGPAVIAVFLLAGLGWRLPLHVVLMPHHVIHHHLLHTRVPVHHVLALTFLLWGQL